MLSDLQMAKIPNLFHMFNIDKNGYLTQYDVERIIQGCSAMRGWDKSSEEYSTFSSTFLGFWIAVTTMADKNKDDQIDLQEFLGFFDNIIQTPDQYNMVVNGLSHSIFGTFDLDSDGSLTSEEYVRFYEVMGLDINLAPDIYTKLDKESDGAITIEELAQLVDQFFRSQDASAPGNEFFGRVSV